MNIAAILSEYTECYTVRVVSQVRLTVNVVVVNVSPAWTIATSLQNVLLFWWRDARQLGRGGRDADDPPMYRPRRRPARRFQATLQRNLPSDEATWSFRARLAAVIVSWNRNTHGHADEKSSGNWRLNPLWAPGSLRSTHGCGSPPSLALREPGGNTPPEKFRNFICKIGRSRAFLAGNGSQCRP